MLRVVAPRIAFASTPGPWGPIHVAASPAGVVAIDILAPAEEFEAELERRFGAGAAQRVSTGSSDASERGEAESSEVGAAMARLREGIAAVDRFLDRDPGAFDDLPLDLADRPAWDRAVLEAVRAVPWGVTSSYGRIATAIGRRGAARAVGGAVGRNPISLAIPCHRVIAGDGTLGGYGGGWWGSREHRLDLKRDLLGREGTDLRNRSTMADNASVTHATPGPRRPR
jgi:O-6-methylguanine DNA methyltransferase